MSVAVFIEHKGERIEITNAERFTEERCDVCGQFLPVPESLLVNLSVSIGQTTPTHSSLSGHPEHILDKVASLLAAAARELDS